MAKGRGRSKGKGRRSPNPRALRGEKTKGARLWYVGGFQA
ncbi:phage DNA packaging protein J [Lelliottia sp. SL45]|nr:phage DNA packaging protein J [Lelliottia sp. SL45]MCY1699064.1 phage DNA packaging protein J [Lelliottia sp. SL45]